MQSIYGTFVEAAIPAGDAPLTGQEQVRCATRRCAIQQALWRPVRQPRPITAVVVVAIPACACRPGPARQYSCCIGWTHARLSCAATACPARLFLLARQPSVLPTNRLPQVLIQNFKAALGLPDDLAAPAHIECGRRILRGRMEASTRGEDIEVRTRLDVVLSGPSYAPFRAAVRQQHAALHPQAPSPGEPPPEPALRGMPPAQALAVHQRCVRLLLAGTCVTFVPVHLIACSRGAPRRPPAGAQDLPEADLRVQPGVWRPPGRLPAALAARVWPHGRTGGFSF